MKPGIPHANIRLKKGTAIRPQEEQQQRALCGGKKQNQHTQQTGIFQLHFMPRPAALPPEAQA